MSELNLVSSWSRDFTVDSTDGSSIMVTYGYVRGGVGPMTTHFYSQKVVSYLIRESQISAGIDSHFNKKKVTEYQIHQLNIIAREKIKYTKEKTRQNNLESMSNEYSLNIQYVSICEDNLMLISLLNNPQNKNNILLNKLFVNKYRVLMSLFQGKFTIRNTNH